VLLGGENTSSTHGLDLLLGNPGEEPGLHDHWLLRKSSLSENLEETSPGDVNNGGLGLLSGILCSGLLRYKGPELVQVDTGLVQVGVVGVHVEVPHTHFTEVSRMVLVEINPVVMLATSVTTSSGMLPVLSNPTVSMRHVPSQLPGLLGFLEGSHTSLVEVNQAIIA